MENTSQIKKTSLTLSFPNPIDGLIIIKAKLSKKISEMFSSIFGNLKQTNSSGGTTPNLNVSSRIKTPKFSNPFRSFKFNKKTIMQAAIPVMVVIVLVGAVLVATRQDSNRVAGVNTGIDLTPVKTTSINREFKFPLKDEAGKDAGEFSYTIESAELRRQIVVKGQTATAVEGRIFLIVNLKIVNSLDQGLNINSRDYLRISVNGNDREWFAPDIHNDPVEAQAISTKNTRVGLAINESDKNIRLQIGEIDGEKTVIPLSFK